MLVTALVRFAIVLFYLSVCTTQVNILMTRTLDHLNGYGLAYCENIQPGECCLTPRTLGATHVRFRDLRSMDIAAVWSRRVVLAPLTWWQRLLPGDLAPIQQRTIITGCSGRVANSRRGPGEQIWEYRPDYSNHPDSELLAYGASYISVPFTMPPKEEDGNWLAAEGMLGLVYGGSQWFASDSAKDYLYRIGLKKRNEPRDVRSSQIGQLYAKQPAGILLPTVVAINGSNYTQDTLGSMIYKDETGESFDLTSEFIYDL